MEADDRDESGLSERGAWEDSKQLHSRMAQGDAEYGEKNNIKHRG